MEIRPVDPRDESWLIPEPRYRVYFFDASGNSDEYEIAGADVAAVSTWAEAHGEGRTYTLYACVPRNGLGYRVREHSHACGLSIAALAAHPRWALSQGCGKVVN